jgi:hypothetical protein
LPAAAAAAAAVQFLPVLTQINTGNLCSAKISHRERRKVRAVPRYPSRA